MNDILYHLDDLSDVVPFFSPTSFLVFLNDEAFECLQIPKVQAAVDAGDGRRANELLREHIASLSPNAESSVLRAFTSTFHEFKHFWDHVGTTYGLARLGLALRRQIDTRTLISLIREGEPLQLPLLANRAHSFNDEARAGELLVEIAETRFQEQVLDDVGIRSFVVDAPLEECPPEARIVVTGPKATHWVPAYAIRGSDKEGRTWMISIPFGGRAICEGAAMALELDILSGVFGSWAADERKRDFMGFDRTRPDRSYYGACDLFLSRHVKPFPFDLLVAMCDLALLGEVGGNDRESFHPGWRFRRLVDLVAERGWPSGKFRWDEGSGAWEEWYRDLFVALNKRPLDDFLSETRAGLAEKLTQLGSMNGRIEMALTEIYKAADRLFELRQRAALILASGDYLYRAMANTFWAGPAPNLDGSLAKVELPTPTVVKASDASVVGGEGETGALVALAVEGKILTDLLVSSKIVCPLVEASFNCPLRKPGCGRMPGELSTSDHPSCSFKSALHGLGLLQKQIKGLEDN